uniref:NADH-ubiquinone oxidoreductase chain 2 n=1 Tax=Asiemphytus rufocephalus TaxID=1742410 RepID=A0A1I9K734_9HYME|nr:NADH dehydrogenase subunit 2 [Asiemphytus rufocephalus]
MFTFIMMTKFLFINNNKMIKLSMMKILFLMILIFSTMITINSSSWINAWMGMEINLMSFIPLMMNKLKNKKNSNSMMIYFIIQAGASSILMMMIIMMKMELNFMKFNLIMNMIQMSLLLKLGASPFHWWTPKFTINLNWNNLFIFLTWQKIAPMFLLISMNSNSMIYMSTLMSTLIGAIMGMNQTLIKLIMVYSSINHLGWMLMMLIINMKMLMMYFIIYSLINFMICMMMNNLNMMFLNQLIKNNNQNLNLKLIIISLFFSLSGLPPFIGFLPKLFSLILMLKNNLIFESILFIFMAIISLSFYINPLMSIFINKKFNMKWNNKINEIFKMINSIILMNLILIMLILTPIMNNII